MKKLRRKKDEKKYDEDCHTNFMFLMQYLQRYKESIAYEAIGMLPNKKRIKEDELQDQACLKAEEIWPIAKSGPKKGKIIPTYDTHGKIVVDPAGNILKDQYLLDYNIYKALHVQEKLKEEAVRGPIKFENLSKKEREEIQELFSKNKRESYLNKND